MKSRIALLVTALAVVAALAAGGAGANGSPYSPGLVHGWDGVEAADGQLRYVTLESNRWTVVAAIRVRSGRVVRFNELRGFYGVPIVAYDGSTGGLSGDGRTLVVASYGPNPGNPGFTRFAALNTRTLSKRAVFELRGSWAFDAISPDGSTIYLVEYLSAGPSPRYKVRVFDTVKERLLPGAIVDRLEKEALMRGQPVTRAVGAGGRWAYTLYARTKKEPFVHALDTVRKQAFCIDLPLEFGQQRQMGLRLAPGSNGELNIRQGNTIVAVVDTETFEVRTS
jgi:hypothetical protein